jgi:acyl transferase domain-containing protein
MNINSSLKKTPIAVVGMSSMFADAGNIEEFWTNIVQSKDSIVDVPDSRWSISDYYDADMTAEDKTYCKVGGFLPEIDFNPMEFGLPPNILEVTDVSQLLALVAARDAFEDAGYGKESAKFTAELKERTGVLLGVGGGQKLITPLTARLQFPVWEKALRASGIAEEDIPKIVDKMKKAYIGWNENSFPGMLGNVISGRITNRFDLGGINSVVDAACAASLSAIKMAVSELIEGRVDMMLTGGVDTDNSPFMYMSFSKTPAFSKSGHIRPFDDAADGMLIGEGVGMLVLKRLEDAERDGDRIYAVIKGVGTSSDGRFKSVYAPRPSGQALAMRRTYEDAGFEPATVGLIEGHGTGTGAGDPTEFESMQMVFGENNQKKNHVGIGSVKSQVGHTKAAAGSAGMIKAALSLYHKVLPGSINVTKPNSKFNIEDSAFYINSETRPWFKHEHPRRVGVSAFGFGGINVHFALEEYNSEPLQQDRLHKPFHSILLKANTPDELLVECQNALNGLNSENPKETYFELKNSSEVFQVSKNEARLGFVVESIEDCIYNLTVAIKLLQADKNAWDHPKGIHFRPNGIEASEKVVALFSGQGSQYVGMGTAIVNAFPEVQKAYAKLDAIFEKDQQTVLTDIVFPKPVFTNEEKAAQQTELTQTQFAQPSIGALSMGMYKTMTNAGFKADFMAGHSFGELTALWAGEVISDDHFLFLAKARGQAMAKQSGQSDTGSMLAVKATEEQVTPFLSQMDDVTIANLNSTSQLVLGGSTPAIVAAKTLLKSNKIKSVQLPVSAAFHTSYVGHAQQPFAEAIQSCEFKTASTPVYSNTTAQPYPNGSEEMKTILGGHILNAVQFKSQIENIYNAGGRIFVEFGPKPVLTNLVKDILKDKDHSAIAMNPNAQNNSDLQFRQGVVQLQVLGLPIGNIDTFHREETKPQAITKMNVKLSGNNYVSAPTQKAYDEVLNDNFKIKQSNSVQNPVPEIKETVVAQAVAVDQNEEDLMNKETLNLIKETLEHFKNQQSKSIEMFQNMISDQNKQSIELIQMLGKSFGNDAASNIPSVSNLKAAPAKNGFSAPKPTSNGNGNGMSHKNKSVEKTPVVQSPAEVLDVPQTAKVESSQSTDLVTEILMKVVSEKTGYPAEMLELSMDMEADLGIDSIKRVEIFGAITEQHAELSNINPQELTELRTLGEIVTYISGKSVTPSAPAPQSTPTPQAEAPAAVAQPATVETPQPVSNETSTANDSMVTEILMKVVSEKTGYPAEMLELSMDMEADLGIDSIKRVEIFGAITEQHPDLSNINPQELTELRTLGEIVTYISGKSVTPSAPASQNTPTPQAEAPAAVAQPVVVETPQPVAVETTSANDTMVTEILMKVVSEKTGYPAEMLELSMDMEADLGIDSIKRVEIFGAITEQHPDLSNINPQELTELRTLGEIVTYISGKSVAPSAPQSTPAPEPAAPVAQPIVETPQASSNGTAPATDNMVTEILMKVVSEKTGYPAEMLELSMDMEADLGIDSIKRVEIFGAITEQHAELSDINPQELTELRTLGEIVDYISAKSKKKVLV